MNASKTIETSPRIVIPGLINRLCVFTLFLLLAQNAVATTDVKLCSMSAGVSSADTGYYNINGGNTDSLRAKLANSANFGASGEFGDYNFQFITYGDPAVPFTPDGSDSLDALQAQCDIWYSGNEANDDYSAAQLDAVLEFAESGNIVVASCDDSSHNPFCADPTINVLTVAGASSSALSSVDVYVPGLDYSFEEDANECTYTAENDIAVSSDNTFTLSDNTNLSTNNNFEIVTTHKTTLLDGEAATTSFIHLFSNGGLVAGFVDYGMIQAGATSTLSSGAGSSNINDRFVVGMFARFARYSSSGAFTVFGSSTSIGNAISIATTNDKGESSVAQAFSRPIFSDKDEAGIESDALYWTGELRLFFIDQNGIFREDTDHDGQLAAKVSTLASEGGEGGGTTGTDRAFKLVYDEAQRTTQVQYLTVSLNNDASLSGITDDGAPVDSQDLQAIWTANEALQNIANDAATNSSNRVYSNQISDASGRGRYIFTSINNTQAAFVWSANGSGNADLNPTNVELLNLPTTTADQGLADAANSTFDAAITAYDAAVPATSIVNAFDLAVYLGYSSVEDLLATMNYNGNGNFKFLFVSTGYMTQADYNVLKDLFENYQTTSEGDELVNWARGDDSGSIFRSRTSNVSGKRYLLGDIENSNPVQVIEPSSAYDDADYKTFRNQYRHRRRMVYVGANDGMLHAFNGGFWDDIKKTFREDLSQINAGVSVTAHPLGSELWAYVPENALSKLLDLAANDFVTASGELEPDTHYYFVDGSLQHFDAQIFSDDTTHPGGWGTILVAATGYGGHGNTYVNDSGETVTTESSIIVLDVTDPEVEPSVISVISDADLNMTTTKPTIYNSGGNWYLAFGSGVTDPINHIDTSDATSPKLYLFLLDDSLTNGGTKIAIGLTDISNSSFVGNISAVDWDGDDSDDALYFGTTEQASATDEPSGDLRMYYAGDVYKIMDNNVPITVEPHLSIDDNGQKWIAVGSGKTYSQRDIALTGQQYFIGLKQNTLEDEATLDTAEKNFSDLQNVNDVTVNSDSSLTFGSFSPVVADTDTADINTIEAFVDYIALDNIAGWQLELDPSQNGIGSERTTSPAISIRDLLLFATFQETDVSSACSTTGNSLIYGVDLKTGLRYLPSTGPGVFIDDDDDGSEISTDAGQGVIDNLTFFATGDNEGRILGPNDLGEIPNIHIRAETQSSSGDYGRKSWTEIEF